MRISRRRLLQYPVAMGLLVRQLPVHARQKAPGHPSGKTLKAYVDTLIPADETPGASQLGVDREMLAKGRTNDDYQRALVFATSWLDKQARIRGSRDFASLNQSARDAIVARAAAADRESTENLFFEITRTDAFLHYYARPESWHGIADYQGPPQPLGYLDYYLPPRK